ncbi:MAG: carbohydrate ABC transporter permease [Bacteroidota bacterium]
MGDSLSGIRSSGIDKTLHGLFLGLTVAWVLALLMPVAYTIGDALKSTREIVGSRLIWIPAVPRAMEIAVDYSDYAREQEALGIAAADIRRKIADEALALQWGVLQDLDQDQKVWDVAVTCFMGGRRIHQVRSNRKEWVIFKYLCGKTSYTLPIGLFSFFQQYPEREARATYWHERDWTGDEATVPANNSALAERVRATIRDLPLRYVFDQPKEPLKGRVLTVNERPAPERLLDNFFIAVRTAANVQDDPLGFFRYFLNSVFVVLVGILSQCAISGSAGYALSRLFSPGITKIALLFVVITLFIPGLVLLTPLYVTISDFKLAGTIWGIIFPYAAWGLNVFLFKEFFDQLPGELFEAARIDGCGETGIFVRLVLPTSKAVFGVVTLLTFSAIWGDFIWQNVATIGNSKIWTFPVGLTYTVLGGVGGQAVFTGDREIRPEIGAAASIFAAIPTIVIFGLMQNSIKKGALIGSVKG